MPLVSNSQDALHWVRKKGSSGKQKGSFQKGPFSRVFLENLEILENPQRAENKGQTEHLLEIPEN